jgi:hypothetical protein
LIRDANGIAFELCEIDGIDVEDGIDGSLIIVQPAAARALAMAFEIEVEKLRRRSRLVDSRYPGSGVD